MFAKKIITTICIISTALGHSASHDKTIAHITSSSNPTMHDFIGFASSKAGACTISTPVHVEPGKDFPITVVYSEMPELKNEDTLSQMVSLFANANQSPDSTPELFNATVQRMIEQFAVKSEDNSNHTKLNALILCTKLSQERLESFGSSPMRAEGLQLKYGFSGSVGWYQDCEQDIIYAEWTNDFGHCEYDEPLRCSPQERADTLLQKSLYAKFALVLDIPQFIQLRDAAASNTKDH